MLGIPFEISNFFVQCWHAFSTAYDFITCSSTTMFNPLLAPRLHYSVFPKTPVTARALLLINSHLSNVESGDKLNYLKFELLSDCVSRA